MDRGTGPGDLQQRQVYPGHKESQSAAQEGRRKGGTAILAYFITLKYSLDVIARISGFPLLIMPENGKTKFILHLLTSIE